MENSTNSGTYVSQAVNPVIQRIPDTYPPKRTSYRRPVDAQPAPAISNTMESNTARPVAASTSNGVSRGSSHRRRQSQNIPPPTTGEMSESIPAAPDVPRAPPTSYRNPYVTKTSARTPQRTSSGRSRDPAIQLNPSRQQATIQTAADRLYDLRSPPYAPVEPLSGTVERRGSSRIPSVPDRSPLQKLEGKLDDISKEERRARILEAELAAQEKAEAEMRARRAAEQQKQQQRVVSLPMSGADRAVGPPNRSSSSKRHVSMPVQHRSPQISDIDSEDGYGYDLSEPWDPSGSGAAAPHREPSQKKPRVSSGPPHSDASVMRHSSLKGKEPIGVARGSGSYRDRSAVPASQGILRKPVQVAPAGLGLVGVDDTSAGAEVTRSDSTRGQGRRDSRGIMAAQMEMQQQQIDQKSNAQRHLQPHDAPAAPTQRKSVGFSEPDTDAQPAMHDSRLQHFKDKFSHHDTERTYVAPPTLDEWRGAPVGTLGAEDLDLDIPVRTNSGNKAWWEESQSTRRRRSGGYAQPTFDGYADETPAPTTFTPKLYLKCGPLLRYTGIRKDRSSNGKERAVWRGSVMIVTTDAQSSYSKVPTLRLFKQPMDILPPPPMEINGDQLDPSYVDPVEGQIKVSRIGETFFVRPVDELAENEDLSRREDGTGLFSLTKSAAHGSSSKTSRIHKKDGEKLGKLRTIPGIRLYAERGVTFWRFNLEIELGPSQTRIAYRINQGPALAFWVPAKEESMNIMFHSCNGFSYSVDSDEFCGPDPMWRDVLNTHQTRPFHVMIGGGDQIYNDAVMRETTLFRQWTEHRNPLQKHKTAFSEEMQNELEQFYLDRYSMWFSQGIFGMANSQIPMVNIWDDHDIIDGYGSYPHHFMETPVFTGIGAVAFKYYLLFQHQSVVAETEKTEPSWVLGKNPGPYIKERSRSVFMSMGGHVSFLGLDCRTERQRDEILTEDSYDIIFDRLEDEIVKGETKHLIVLLGVPIAYPRLNFLENVLTSRLMDPIKALGRAGMLGNFVNKFDGGVEILDDLDDHWTAKHHKEERNWFIRELQHIASTKSVRVTILGGDVHLAAIGQFYSNKKLNIPKDKDHRYMPNVVSSAIVNTPPPDMMADIINKRNKVHHLDPYTDEDMIPIFTHGVDGKKRNNTHLLPHRNWCSIREYNPGTTPPPTPPSPSDEPGLQRRLSDFTPGQMVRRFSASQNRQSSRGRGPPLAFYNNPSNAAADNEQAHTHNQPQSSFSPDRSESERPRSRRNSLTSLFRRRGSADNTRPDSSQSMPPAKNRNSMSQDPPSTFHRRPSVLSKKGIQQHGEFIDLQGGLDICLNLEVSRNDPAGITTPYRLLVPALNYTEPAGGTIEKERGKNRGLFAAFRNKRNTRIGDDGYSESGSESGHESDSIGEVSQDEEEDKHYKVGPRIIIPGFSRNKRQSAPVQPTKERRLSSGYHSNPNEPLGSAQTDGASHLAPPHQGRRQSMDADAGTSTRASAWESAAAKRHVSAPQYPAAQEQATVIPSRSASTRKQPNYNSSHKSQLPAPEADPKVHRRSMGGILNQHHHDKKWEHEAHVLSHTPSTKRSKRNSYPPHPAIVGAGPGSPYREGPGLQARQDTAGGDYFAHVPGSAEARASKRNSVIEPEYATKPIQRAEYAAPVRNGYDRKPMPAYPEYPQRNGNAGVGARYLGGGKYEDEEDDYSSVDEDQPSRSGREGPPSEESFVLPKRKKRWMIWR